MKFNQSSLKLSAFFLAFLLIFNQFAAARPTANPFLQDDANGEETAACQLDSFAHD